MKMITPTPAKKRAIKKYSKEEAVKDSKAYFANEALSADVFVNKYALRDLDDRIDENTPDLLHQRLASEFARIDAEKYNLDFEERYNLYYDSLKNFSRIVAQGSPMAAVGNPYQVMSASNCVVVESPEDSIAGITKTGAELAQLYKRRAGVGLDISTLRPDGMTVNNAARTTSGAWSFADYYSYITRMIAQKSRRGALMITLDVHHPDVENFATMKRDLTKVTGANVSIRLSDEFLKAVDEDKEYEQRWPCEGTPTIRKKVSARQVWKTIIDSATATAEPGLIFWDRMTKRLPAHSYPNFKSRSTNPCCFSTVQDVYVITNSGIKEIKKITNKDLIWVDENSSWEKTSGYFKAGKHPVYRVTFSNQEQLLITSNHKLERIVKKRNYVLKTLVELSELKVGDAIAHHINYVGKFGTKGSYEEGLVLGWMTGDGFLSYKDADSRFPTLGLSFWKQEHDVAPKLQAALKNLGYSLSIQNNLIKNNEVKRILSDGIVERLTYEYQFNPWLFKSGFNPFLFETSESFLKGYLSSYFSSDGTIQIIPEQSRYAVQLASIDKSRLEQVKNLLLLFGIKSGISLMREAGEAEFDGKGYKTKDCYRLSITGASNIKKFHDKIGFICDIKQKRLEQFESEIFPSMRIEKQKDYVTIETIELVGEHEVGCIEVENAHKFTANGIISGNSEISLSAYDSCRLISLNLTGYVKNAFESNSLFDWELFKKDIATAMQMADNLVDLELELIEKIKSVCDGAEEKDLWQKLWNAGHQGRRTGLGTHGLGDTLAQLRIKYDSQGALNFVDKLYETLRNEAYGTSITLAEIRGPFPAFNWEVEKDNEYIRDLPAELLKKMANTGRRNISLLTQAPTGSISILSKSGEFNRFNISSGVEPVFRNFYTRRKKINPNDVNTRVDFTDNLGDKWQEYSVYHSNILNYVEKIEKIDVSNLEDETTQNKLKEISKRLPDYFVTSDQIDWKFRVALQGVEQHYLDHSISSTINLPKGTTPETVGGIYLAGWKNGLKGVTVYVEGSRDGVLIAETKKPSLDSNARPTTVIRMDAPKRPKELPCDIHHCQVNSKQWIALVGLLEGEPYEMFGGFSEMIQLPKKYKTGTLLRKAQGKYELHVKIDEEDEIVVKDILSAFNNAELAWVTRLVSTSLRHGTPVSFLSEQLSKEGKINDFNKVLSRVLKKYIKDGEKVKSSAKCSSCGSSDLKYQEGCPVCLNCGHTKCS